jgi:hypothetical protein
LRLQLRALTEKRERIDRAINAIKEAEKLVRSNQPTDASVLRKIIEAIEIQPQEDFMRQYYSDAGWAKRILLREQTSPQTRESYQQNWKQLFLEIEAALDLDPASEPVLARRWVLLAEVVSGGDAEIKAGAIKAWEDHRNWPVAEQDALFARYGVEPASDRNLSMMRVERVAKFIGQAIGRKYYGALNSIRLDLINKPPKQGRSKLWVELFRDVESALGESPASDRAQALAARWTELKRDVEPGTDKVDPRLEAFRDVLRQKWPQNASVAVVSQVARLYRIEQVSQFLENAIAHRKDRRDSA